MSLNIQASDWVPQTLPNTPIQFGNPQYLACSFCMTVDLLQATGEHLQKWKWHWAAAHGFFLGMVAAPCFLQRIWSSKQAPTYLEMQNRLKQIRLGK